MCRFIKLLFVTCLLSPRLDAGPAYLISIDGLQPDLLQTLHQDQKLKAGKGFSWLMERSLVVDRALPIVSITAPSHISTITCSPPSRHAVIANEFIRDGDLVNGFNASFQSEALWRAAMRQGRSVLSLAYVGADGRSVERSATYGLAYPDPERLGPGQTLDLDGTAETTVDLVLNPKTQEKRTLRLQWDRSNPSAPLLRIIVEEQKLAGSLKPDGQAFDLYSVERTGIKRRSIFRLLPGSNGESWRLHISKASYNNAYPESFRARLDALNLVWPDYSVKGLKLPLTQAAEAQGTIDRFLTDVAERLVPELKVDLVLFYQPLLDTLGHELQNRLPRPFRSEAQDEVTKAFLAGFQLVDRNLDRLLSTADAKTPIVLVGDHGMDAIERMVNLSALLRPSEKKVVRFVTSGQLVLLYPAEPQFAAAADRVGQDLRQRLMRLRNPEGKPTLAQAARRSEARKKGRNFEKEWQFGDALWAFQGLSGDWITFDPRSPALFQKPRAGGMHGTTNAVEAMATRMLIHGPDVKPARIAQASLLSAVPSLTQMMGIKPPHDCVGVSLLQGQSLTRR